MTIEKVPQHIQDNAAKIAAGITYDAEGNGKATDEKALVESLLPEGLDIPTIKKAQEFVLDLADSVTLANATAGLDLMKANSELQTVGTKIKIGLDTISTEYARSVQRRNPSTGETFQKHGVVSTKLASGVGAGRGNYKRIAEEMSSRAASVFGQ